MKKKIFALLTALVLLLGMIPAQAFAAEMTSEIAIAPQYEDARGFSGGYAAVKKDGKWGYIDENGDVVVDFKYDWAADFSEGVAVTATVETLINSDSDYSADYWIMHLIDAEGMDIVLLDPENWWANFDGYDVPPLMSWYDGETPLDEWEDTRQWFCSGGVVYVDGNIYTKTGETISLKESEESKLFVPTGWGNYEEPFDYFYATGPCVDGVIPMKAAYVGQVTNNEQAFLMDTEGNIVDTFEPVNYETGTGIHEVMAPDDGRILVTTLGEEDGEGSGYWWVCYGVMDLDQNWIAEPVYTNYYIRMNGDFYTEYGTLTLADENGRWGAVDLNGKTLVDFKYNWMSVFSGGYAPAQLDDGTCVYLDTKGNTYQIGGIDGGVADVTVCGSFNSDGVAAVYDVTTGTAYCILNQPVNGVFPAIEGSDLIDPSVYFPGYDGTGTPSSTPNVDELVVIEENGLYGYLRLNLKGVVNPFTDVPADSFYYEPVLWALENGITNGATETTFNPNGTCLRAQVVTFLHRAEGSPAPSSKRNPFSDVKSSDFFYKPVLWAVEEGITNGTSATTFGSYDNCNRAAVVTFLWRAAGCPEPETTKNPFKDVKSTDFFYKAVLWAVENGITNGVDATHFGPTQTCNRAQVVTFLYRAYN